MDSEYQYAFRENAKGVSTRSVYVQKGDELEQFIFDTHALPAVRALPGKHVLVDIGSGEGRYSRYFGAEFERVIAVEPDEHRFQRTREELSDMRNVECVHGTAGACSFEGYADVVVNIHVLQHIHRDAVQEIFDFAGQRICSNGLFILAATKRTVLDYPWNIAWQDDASHYSAVPEQVFEYVTSANVPGVLPVRKERTNAFVEELENRGFSIETLVEYAPRFVDQKHLLGGRLFMFLYRNLSARVFHRLANLIGYPLHEDVLIVARKR